MGTLTEADAAQRMVVCAGLDRVARAVSVITVVVAGRVHGTTVDSLAVVSTDPPFVGVSLHRDSRALALIDVAGGFATSVLAADQVAAARQFASRGRADGYAQFAGVDWTPGPQTEAPLLRGALAHFECRTVASLPTGDHVLVVAQVVGGDLGGVRDSERHPLFRYRRRYERLAIPAENL